MRSISKGARVAFFTIQCNEKAELTQIYIVVVG